MDDNTKPTRNYKDTLFGSLFYSCEDAVENAKSLYKALTGREVKTVEKCRLEDVLFRQFLNDVAYIMDDVFICFIEHQSTLNPNMALRLLIYLARTYERFFTGKNLCVFRTIRAILRYLQVISEDTVISGCLAVYPIFW